MARKPKDQVQNEVAALAPVTTPTTPDAEALDRLPPLVTTPEQMAPLEGATPPWAVAQMAPKVGDVPAPQPKRFLVSRDGLFMVRGSRVSMKAGKVIDTLNYDVDLLRSQGLVAEELPAG